MDKLEMRIMSAETEVKQKKQYLQASIKKLIELGRKKIYLKRRFTMLMFHRQKMYGVMPMKRQPQNVCVKY